MADFCAGVILGAALFGRRFVPLDDPLRALLDRATAAELARRRALGQHADLANMNAGALLAINAIEKAGCDRIIQPLAEYMVAARRASEMALQEIDADHATP